MKPFTFSLTAFLSILCASTCLASVKPAVKGIYEDIGFSVSGAEPGAISTPASFQEILKLQFSPYGPDLNPKPVARVSIRDAQDELEIIGLNEEGKEVWRGKWQSGPQYVINGDHRVLRLRGEGQDDSAYAFVMKPTADGKLLSVEVARLKPT